MRAAAPRELAQVEAARLTRPLRPAHVTVASDLMKVPGVVSVGPVAGFLVAVFAIIEGREAWAGELVEDDD